MSLNKHISKKIKTSFENESKTAPKQVWNNLNESLTNKNIDSAIKTSFEKEAFKAPAFDYNNLLDNRTELEDKIAKSFDAEKNVLPNLIWENIQDSVDINHVWVNLKDNINVSTFSRLKFAVACGLIGFILFFPTIQLKNPSNTHQFNVASFYTSTPIETINLIADAKTVTASTPSGAQADQIQVSNLELAENDVSKIEMPVLTENNSIKLHTSTILAHVKEGEFEMDLLETPLHFINQDQSHTKIETAGFSMPEQQKDSGFRLGLITNINNTWINNSDLRESLSKNSLLLSKMAFTTSNGIVVDYWFNGKFGLSFSHFLNSLIKNKIGFYEDGFYKTKTTEINYFKSVITLNWRKPLLNKRSTQNYLISAGPYIGFNKSSIIKTGEVITAFNSTYKKVDYGLKLCVGKEHQWSKFILGYGLNSDLGLRNIIADPTEASLATNFNFGIYGTIKYDLGNN